MSTNPLITARDRGQSIWRDQLSRGFILSGGLRDLIENDGVRGVTTNPSIFEKAIAGSEDYDGHIQLLALQDRSPEEIYQALTVGDVRLAADELRDLYDDSNGHHGFVSLEVNPHLAYDAEGTVEEAERLWKAVDRPNIFIKVPGTEPGLDAIRTLISRGINVNVTLLFGLPRYRRVAEAYIAGLEDRVAAGEPVDRVRSVASFFLSRIDVLVDPALKDIVEAGGEGAETAKRLYGNTAVASAKLAYQIYREVFAGDRFVRLQNQGAATQRVLWASTSTKNPDFSDVKYVDALIGPDTINTLPQDTIDAFRDHGSAEPRLETGLEDAREVLQRLPEVGIDIDRVTEQLEREGVEKFNQPYDSLMATIADARKSARDAAADPQEVDAAGSAQAVTDRVVTLQEREFCEGFHKRDAALWSTDPGVQRQIGDSLGWLDAPGVMGGRVTELLGFAREAKRHGFRHVVHMGMGGSSLTPLVFDRMFDTGNAGLPLTVLDTTSPETVGDIAAQVPLEHTLFIIASKSGTTTEPLDFGEYFYHRLHEIKGDRAGENFVAITDPGTPLVDLARERSFRRVFLNMEDVGGRYSALTYVGLVPAALMGVDIAKLLARGQRMLRACSQCTPLRENPGMTLGAALGELARSGRDKVTFVAAPEFAALGMWLEQLLAESTGKHGTGLVPVAGEPTVDPGRYGDDRVFVHLRRDGDPADDDLAAAVRGIAAAGHPVIRITMSDAFDLGGEFVRWEIATAVAGAVLGINPFDQPDVQSAKDATRDVLSRYRETGTLTDETPGVEGDGIRVYGASGDDVGAALKAFAGQSNEGDYIAVLAYIPEAGRTHGVLESIRAEMLRRPRVSTMLSYGPRYLHSTGQLHKGGPDTGLFLIITADARDDIDVPGRGYSFGTLRLAQAAGDVEALRNNKRRVLRVHITGDIGGALADLQRALHEGVS